jgi:dihydrofolate reductase
MIIGLFAIDDIGGIGVDGRMPWPSNREDLQWFKSTTEEQIVVMGKNTWNSSDMPKPLPNRVNVIITNNYIENTSAAVSQIKGNVCDSLRMLQEINPTKNVFVIGGANILKQSQSVLEKLYVTRIPGEYRSDVKIEMSEFTKGFKLENIINLGSCKVEEYINENLS